jgi:hypothetical protein
MIGNRCEQASGIGMTRLGEDGAGDAVFYDSPGIHHGNSISYLADER